MTVGCGIWTHWAEGYNVLYLDGHVSWRHDRKGVTIAAAVNHGPSNYVQQEAHWDTYFQDQ